MEYLVYDVTPESQNGVLQKIGTSLPRELEVALYYVEEMEIEDISEKKTTNMFTYSTSKISDDKIFADIFKTDEQDKALHIVEQNTDGFDIKEVVPEEEIPFTEGTAGIGKVNGELVGLVERGFGSYFCSSISGLDFEPQFSSDPYEIIRQSHSIGDTKIRLDEDSKVYSALFSEPPESELQEDMGLGSVSPASKVNNLYNSFQLSDSHDIVLQISQEEWTENREMMQQLADSDFVERIKVENTKDGVVTITDEDEAARKTVEVRNTTGEDMIIRAFEKLE